MLSTKFFEIGTVDGTIPTEDGERILRRVYGRHIARLLITAYLGEATRGQRGDIARTIRQTVAEER